MAPMIIPMIISEDKINNYSYYKIIYFIFYYIYLYIYIIYKNGKIIQNFK